MPRQTSKTFTGKGDIRWIGDTHALYHSFSAVVSATKANFPLGYVPSGTPVTQDGDNFALANGALAEGAEVVGFVAQDQPLGGTDAEKLNIPVMDRGRVLTSFLPAPHNATTPADFAAALKPGVAINFLTA